MNAVSITVASLQTLLNGVTVQQVEGLKAPLSGQTLDGALSAFAKSEKRDLALLGAYAHTFKGMVQSLIHGNQTILKGLESTVKKTSAAYAALVNMGVVSPAGELLVGVDEGINKKERSSTEKALMGQTMLFVAHLWDARKVAAAEAAAAKKLAAADKKAAEVAEAAAEVAPILSHGQEQEAAVGFLLQCIEAGTLSSELAAQLRSALRISQPALI